MVVIISYVFLKESDGYFSSIKRSSNSVKRLMKSGEFNDSLKYNISTALDSTWIPFNSWSPSLMFSNRSSIFFVGISI